MSAEAARSVYVHAPFCARRCVYCDFAVTVERAPDARPWLRAVAAELALLERAGEGPAERLDTLYVGGGTPSLLGADAMAGLAELLGTGRVDDPAIEWTAEANPESLTREVAAGWAAAGVNRISLGAQSFSAAALRWMGRLHGPDGPRRAVDAAREAGITNLSVDLIFALPRHVERDWEADLEAVLALDVPHVSLYGLTVEEGTPLHRQVLEGRARPAPEGRYREEYLRAATVLSAAGYEHYEVSNFARPGHRSRHNAVYWSGRPYLGLGSGAHSYAPPTRRWNVRDWAAYEAALAEGRRPEDGRERVEGAAQRLERLWLALRTSDGIAADGLPPAAAELARRWCGQGLARADGTRVRLTPEGWLVMDRLTLDLEGAFGEG
ncbi:MAG: radical SAM family heme chaperone HemW [Gemmatimonadetes bacterium]|nr:MAG: radical SAM family heme chaperone HemW [Gemmatimonadota bacterium]